MPYIEKKLRRIIDKAVKELSEVVLTSGDINYAITKLFLSRHPNTYQEYNELIGILECVKLEFYRRAVVPYEGRKLLENGDVFNE
jgi:hypothetical protein